MTPDELVVGHVYRCHCDTRNCGSTQGRRVRRTKLVEGPHTDLPVYEHGAIVRVHDLSDPAVPQRRVVRPVVTGYGGICGASALLTAQARTIPDAEVTALQRTEQCTAAFGGMQGSTAAQG